MYNKLVVPLNRYNNFAGSFHSLDVFLGKEGATQLSARGYDRLPSLRAGLPPVAIDSEENSCLVHRHSIRASTTMSTRVRKKMTGGKTEFNRASAGVSGKIGDADQRWNLDPIKTRYLFLRSFKNVLIRKKANNHGAGRREGLKEAETPESR